MPLITDAKFALEKLNATLFPGVSASIKVHDGFATEHTKRVYYFQVVAYNWTFLFSTAPGQPPWFSRQSGLL